MRCEAGLAGIVTADTFLLFGPKPPRTDPRIEPFAVGT